MSLARGDSRADLEIARRSQSLRKSLAMVALSARWLHNVKFSCAALNKARSAAEGPPKITRRLLQRQLGGEEHGPACIGSAGDVILSQWGVDSY